MRNPGEFRRRLSSLTEISPEQVRGTLGGIFLCDLRENRRAFGSTQSPGYLRESVREMARFMHREGVISSLPAPEELVDPALLPNLVRKGKN
jgi:hypothetical protein